MTKKVESTASCLSPRRLRWGQREQRCERGPRLRQHEQRVLEHECEHRRAPIQVKGRQPLIFGAIQEKRKVLEPCHLAKNDLICAVLVATPGNGRSEESAGYLQSI